uniref:Uncharacterized protein n=1 Tax=Rhizophora mucronata TaxID=61149 RepID=A0A2P2PMP9_RHIMU
MELSCFALFVFQRERI